MLQKCFVNCRTRSCAHVSDKNLHVLHQQLWHPFPVV